MEHRRIVAAAAAAALLLSTGGAVAAQTNGHSSAAPDLAPASLVSGQLQFDSDGPTRIFDSRSGPPLPSDQAAGGHIVSAKDFVPANATAVLVNITVVATDSGSSGFVAAASDRIRGNSTVNWTAPGIYSNFAFVPVGSTMPALKSILLHYEGTRPVHFVVDLMGWVTT